MKTFRILISLCAVLFLLETGGADFVYGQKKTPPIKKTVANLPTVTQVDSAGLKAVFKQSADAKRPLLVNFWATYCEPCREEFPELVKIDAEFRPQGLDFITVSMDFLAEIKREVPQFLAETKATMPAYLLKTDDESELISHISKEWHGGLPYTVLFDADGKAVYVREGIVKSDVLRAQLEKLLPPKQQ